MLKKECCKKCWNSTNHGWVEYDERCWKSGYILCPEVYLEKGEIIRRYITEQPPENCPYYLENIL